MKNRLFISTIFLVTFCIIACSKKNDKQSEEQIAISSTTDLENNNDSLLNSVSGNLTMKQISTFPNKVILTGLNDHRLVSVYKSKAIKSKTENAIISSYSYDNDESGDESSEHFMPGIDILFGYNLLNIAHYDLKLETGNFLFNHPVLVKTLYFPSFIQDSLDNQPINRNYYLASVYDEDTNKDSLINKNDLRRFYHFDSSCKEKKHLIPSDYSVVRSQYDSKNDIMYVFARHDENKNGTHDKSEPVRIFWFSLKSPDIAKLLY